ncbi:MAG: hypothetical protein IPK16_09120 [Anaerolineales bacterium]|nr:hypothetical protein [Anaerolineales bacterium]
MGVDVIYATGDESTLGAIDRGNPPIIFVDTGELPYWNLQLRHAILMVGYDEVDVFLNDPAWDTAPMTTSWDDLMLAWSEFDYRYALILAKG